jgi:hypothetical protein
MIELLSFPLAKSSASSRCLSRPTGTWPYGLTLTELIARGERGASCA